jgi:hypothetical protein
MAVEGGRPQDGAVKYYAANSREELEQALEDIGNMVIGCTFTLNPPPQNPGAIWVSFDGKWIKRDRDHINGWDYDRNVNQLDFYGPACDRLRSGQVGLLEILMGCATFEDPEDGWNINPGDIAGEDGTGGGDDPGGGGSGDFVNPEDGWNVDPGNIPGGGEPCDPALDDTCRPQ